MTRAGFPSSFFMRTLLITGSYDVASDLLISKLGSEKFIRLNFDRPRDWAITLTESELTIASERDSFSSKEIAKCIWRKPFTSEPIDSPFNEDFSREEWKYTLYEIASLMRSLGKLRMNFPMPDYMMGKLMQQRAAKEFFRVAPIALTVNQEPNTDGEKIAKSLSSTPLSDGKVLYTVDVSNKPLSPDIWYVQDKVGANLDVTVVYLYGKTFAFSLDRSSLKTLDWRKEQFTNATSWTPYSLNTRDSEAIDIYMKKLGLVYGRLDFLEDKQTNELVFLEVNKNGQWAWLDPTFENGLFRAMSAVHDPLSIE